MSATAPQRHQFTVDEVLRMAETGTLPGARVQLIDGDLIEMPPQGPEHASLADALKDLLRAAYPADYRVRAALPIVLPGVTTTLPEPDLAVVPGTAKEFQQRHPRGDEAVLVIEVTYSSHTQDRAKADWYAAAGVPEYWMVDVKPRQVHRFSEPKQGAYGQHEQLDFTATLTFPTTAHTVRLDDLF